LIITLGLLSAVVESNNDNNKNNKNNFFSCFFKNGIFNVVPGVLDVNSSYAYGSFSDDIPKTGWSTLDIKTNKLFDDYLVMEAAGYLEGYITHERIWQFRLNYIPTMFNGSMNAPLPVANWIKENVNWMKTQIATKSNVTYWQHVKLMFIQLQGITKGYNDAAPSNRKIDYNDLLYLNLNGDLEDLVPALSNSTTLKFGKRFNSRCSSIVTLPPPKKR